MKNVKLIYHDDKLFAEMGSVRSEVMGYWETPLMHRFAEIVTQDKGDILEIGFGLGISADRIQEYGVRSHTIVEIHPEIANVARDWAFEKIGKDITIIEGDWFEKIEEICSKKYDAIFFDTHHDNKEWKFYNSIVKPSLKDNGIFAFFSAQLNGSRPAFDKHLLNINKEKVSLIPGKTSYLETDDEITMIAPWTRIKNNPII